MIDDHTTGVRAWTQDIITQTKQK